MTFKDPRSPIKICFELQGHAAGLDRAKRPRAAHARFVLGSLDVQPHPLPYVVWLGVEGLDVPALEVSGGVGAERVNRGVVALDGVLTCGPCLGDALAGSMFEKSFCVFVCLDQLQVIYYGFRC